MYRSLTTGPIQKALLTPTNVKTGNYSANVNELVLCDVADTGSLTVTAPANPKPKDQFGYLLETSDITNDREVSVNRNGSNIASGTDEAPFKLYIKDDLIIFQYVDDTVGWFPVTKQLAPHVCRLNATSTQSLTASTAVRLQLGLAVIDNAGIGDLVNDRITLKRAGTYEISVRIAYTDDNGIHIAAARWGNPVGPDRWLQANSTGLTSSNMVEGKIITSLQSGQHIEGVAFTTDSSSPGTTFLAGQVVSNLEAREIL